MLVKVSLKWKTLFFIFTGLTMITVWLGIGSLIGLVLATNEVS